MKIVRAFAPLALAALLGTTVGKSPPAMPRGDLQSACAQYALYTWAATDSVDGTPGGLEEPASLPGGRIRAIDRAYIFWVNPDGDSPELWEMRFHQASCYVQRGDASDALPVFNELLRHANLPDGRRNLRNYRWPMIHIPENEVWREMALGLMRQGNIGAARRSIDRAYFDYPASAGHAAIALDLTRIDPRARGARGGLSGDQRGVNAGRGEPCQTLNFASGDVNAQLWWYCDARGNFLEAYSFRNGRAFSHFIP